MNPWRPDTFIARLREKGLKEAADGNLSETERARNGWPSGFSRYPGNGPSLLRSCWR
ncbi:hypothetical protein O9H85_15600 [Paenibacillus filicis]|uniref:Uncharacterized protein n=1 Tax=Paenibacillus gyeongsangnamensis TaxID=3388067 RepID=A0ABT4QAC5_9BACL|nr:hypothetical protein [Paenibacillus filicis]MCZ8513834.1 hypothetical protein [Paenibacillus filicis]